MRGQSSKLDLVFKVKAVPGMSVDDDQKSAAIFICGNNLALTLLPDGIIVTVYRSKRFADVILGRLE